MSLRIISKTEFEAHYLNRKAVNIDPSMINFTFYVSDLEAGDTINKSRILSKELNAWRHKYNNTKDDVIKLENARLEKIENTYKNKQTLVCLLIAATLSLLLFFYLKNR